jgi:hypothetical protein
MKAMPRYLVHRTFPEGLEIPVDHTGAETCATVVAGNAAHGVTWLHSYVAPDHHTSYCIYDAPDASAIRCAADDNELPVDAITEVSVLDPYFYH